MLSFLSLPSTCRLLTQLACYYSPTESQHTDAPPNANPPPQSSGAIMGDDDVALRDARRASAPELSHRSSWPRPDGTTFDTVNNYDFMMPEPQQFKLSSSTPSVDSCEPACDPRDVMDHSTIDLDYSRRSTVSSLSSPCLTDVSSMPSDLYEHRDFDHEISILKAKLAARQEYLALHSEELTTDGSQDEQLESPLPSSRRNSTASTASGWAETDTRALSRNDYWNRAHPICTLRFLTDLFSLIDRCMAQAEADSAAADTETETETETPLMTVDEYMLHHDHETAIVPPHIRAQVLARNMEHAKTTEVGWRACHFDEVVLEQRAFREESGWVPGEQFSFGEKGGSAFGPLAGAAAEEEGLVGPLDCV